MFLLASSFLNNVLGLRTYGGAVAAMQAPFVGDSRVEVWVLVVESHDETDQNEIRILMVQERSSVDLRHRP